MGKQQSGRRATLTVLHTAESSTRWVATELAQHTPFIGVFRLTRVCHVARSVPLQTEKSRVFDIIITNLYEDGPTLLPVDDDVGDAGGYEAVDAPAGPDQGVVVHDAVTK